MEKEKQFKFNHNTSYWLVGSYWQNDKPQERLPEFIEKGVWINGYGEDKYTERVNAVRVGDVLICKSTFRKNGKSVLRIKAVGIVTKKTEYGSVLNVDWKKEFITKDLDDLGFYRDTIHSVRDEDLEMFIDILNESGEEDIPTRILFDDFAERIKDTKQEVSSFTINVTELEGTIRVVDSESFFTYKKADLNLYNIGTNPFLNVIDVEKKSQILRLFESWLFLLDKKVLEQESTNKSKPLNTGVVKHALSTNKSDADLLSKGYVNQGIIGYINSEISPTSIPLYSRYQKKSDDYTYLFGPEIEGREKSMSNELRHIGFVPTKWFNNYILLRRFLINTNSTNHFYCTKPNQKLLSEHDFFEELVNSGKIYSTQPELLFFEPLEEIFEEEFETKADILPDTIAIEDELGRKGLMEILFERINKLWGKLRENESYTVLINGEWGSGKSSMLLYLEEELTKNKWTVVKYNAWENQRFEDPWWILVNKVSKEVPSDAFDKSNPYSSRSHRFWQIKTNYSPTYIIAFVVLVLFLIGFNYDVFGTSENIPLFASLLALIGSLWISVQGVVKEIFSKKIYTALQSKNANDPFEVVKSRFDAVLKHKRVAIFIDDLDRCEVEPTVKLLEGIQTLFKNSKVLYVIAADGKWVANCFDKKYEDFKELVESGQTIGNEFLQKNFQLIVDVPKISNIQQIALLNKYLDKKDNNIGQSQEEDISEDKFKDELSTKTNVEDIAKLSANKGASFRKIAAEQVEKIIEVDKRHYTQKLQELGLIPPNPRQIKRLINLFTLKVQVLIIAGTLQEIGEENILRYVLFAFEYPAFDQQLRKGITNNITPEAKEILGDGITSEKIIEFM